MKRQRMAKIVGLGMVGLACAAVSLLARRVDHDDCPQCGHTRELYACEHCGWTLCLPCWQKAEEEQGANICPHCKRGEP